MPFEILSKSKATKNLLWKVIKTRWFWNFGLGDLENNLLTSPALKGAQEILFQITFFFGKTFTVQYSIKTSLEYIKVYVKKGILWQERNLMSFSHNSIILFVTLLGLGLIKINEVSANSNNPRPLLILSNWQDLQGLSFLRKLRSWHQLYI